MRLTADDLARKFGATGGSDCGLRDAAGAVDLAFTPLGEGEVKQVLSDIHAKIRHDGFAKVGAHRAGVWQDAWSDRLARFHASGFDLASLEPGFMSADPIVRIDGRFARAQSPRFELDFFSIFRDWFCARWLGGAKRVMEFGCGSGFNLAPIAAAGEASAVIGLDWSEAACEIAELIGRHGGVPVSGRRFDFFKPDPSLDIDGETAVLTFCALEQTGDAYRPFLDFVAAKRPYRVLHMEPIDAFYDPSNPVDASAIAYHRHRGYLCGFLAALRAREARGDLRILAARRLGFGSRYHEGYSYVVWEPT